MDDVEVAKESVDEALNDMYHAREEAVQNYFATAAVCAAINLAGIRIATAIRSVNA